MKLARFILMLFLFITPAIAVSQETSSITDESENGKQESESPAFPEGLTPEAALLARLSGVFRTEDPASLYGFEIGDKEVDFFLDGTWETRFSGMLSINFSEDGDTFTINPPIFEQTVDMSTWIFLDKTWYFEANFAEEFTRNTVAAGYVGDEESTIKHVRIGNSGIFFPDTYPFIEIGGGNIVSPGIMGTFAGKSWKADTLIRYDTAVQREMVLSGMNEVTDNYIPVEDPVRSKWFVLPSSGITGAVSVYIEDDSGLYPDTRISNRYWRKLNMAEYKVHSLEGVVELSFETGKSVAVVYNGPWISGGGTAGTALQTFVAETRSWFLSSGKPLPDGFLPDPADPQYINELTDRYIIGIDGANALVVQDRGLFSPFALASRYRSTGIQVELVYTQTDNRNRNVAAQAFEGQYAEIFRTDSNAPPDGIERYRTPSSRFPLVPEYPRLYLPSSGGKKPETGLVIRSRSYTPIGTISLGENVIPGTIRIVRNGIADYAFTYDETSSLVTLARPPQTGETVRITWTENDSSARNANLTLAGGIHWKATDSLDFSLASALRWNLSRDGYTDASEGSPGSFILSAGSAWTGETLSAETAVALDLSIHDTTGYYRVFGMGDIPIQLFADREWYVSAPAQTTPVLGLPACGSPNSLFIAERTLDPADRVYLDNTDGSLLPYHSASSANGAVLVMQGTHTELDNWSIADILAGEEGGADFRGAATLSLMIRNPGARDDFDLFIQLGTRTGEDYDDPRTIRTWQLDTPPAGSGWRMQTIELSDSDRMALAAGQNIRLVAVPRDGIVSIPATVLPLSFTIETARIEIRETPFSGSPEPQYTETGRLYVEDITDPEGLKLFDSDTVNRFNQNTVNKVLSVRFTPENTTDAILLHRHMSELALDQYSSLVFYLFAETLPPAGASVTLKLSRPDEYGSAGKTALEVELQTDALTANRWHRIRIDLENRDVFLDEARMGPATANLSVLDRKTRPVRTDIRFDQWDLPPVPVDNSLSGGTATPTEYIVYIDEVHLAGTDTHVSGRNKTAVQWDRPGVLLQAGGIDILSDPFIEITTDTAVGETDKMASGTAVTKMTVLAVKTEANLTASSETDRVADSAGYDVVVPAGPVEFHEFYFADFEGNSFRRNNSLSLSGIMPFRVGTLLDFSGRTLFRSIDGGLHPVIRSDTAGSIAFLLESTFTQNGLPERYDITDTGWQQLWTDTLSYMVSTGESDATERNEKFSFGTDWTTPFDRDSGTVLGAVRFRTGADARYNASTTVSRDSRAETTISFPIYFGRSVLTPAWTRNAGTNRPVTAGGNYGSDTNTLFSDLGDMDFYYSTAPFYDLFKKDMADHIRDSRALNNRTFSNTYRIGWVRSSGAGLSNLWLPHAVDTSISRKTSTSADTDNQQDIWGSSVSASLSALNIAGTYGIHPLFSWYEQDEFSQLYQWSASWGHGFFTWSIDTFHSLLLFFSNGATLSFQNSFHHDSPGISGTGKLTRNSTQTIWKRPAETSILENFIARATTMPLSSRREDSLQFTMTKDEEFTMTIEYSHTLATAIGSNGEVSIWGGTNYSLFRNGNALLELLLGFGGKLMY